MSKDLKYMQFNKQFRERKDAEGEMKVLPGTPMCKECAIYVQADMIKQYLEKQNIGDKEESDNSSSESEEEKMQDNGGGIINRAYNKIRQMKFM